MRYIIIVFLLLLGCNGTLAWSQIPTMDSIESDLEADRARINAIFEKANQFKVGDSYKDVENFWLNKADPKADPPQVQTIATADGTEYIYDYPIWIGDDPENPTYKHFVYYVINDQITQIYTH